MLVLTLLSTWLLCAQTASAVVCYTPDGHNRNAMFNESDGELYAPCDSNAAYSMCCAIGPARVAGGSADTCVNGFCANSGLLWRESCTDPTWKSPSCFKLFVNGSGLVGTGPGVTGGDGYNSSDVTVTACDDGSYCFGDSNRACCQARQGVWLFNGQQYATNPNATSGSSSSSIPSSTSSSTGSPSSQAASASASSTPSSHSSGLSTGAIAGIVVGIIVVVLALAVGLWSVLRRKRRNSEYSAPPQQLPSEPKYELPVSPNARSELPSPHPRSQDLNKDRSMANLKPVELG